MVPDSVLTALEILVGVTVFTTGFLSVRIHNERLRLLQLRDETEARLVEADALGQPIRKLVRPSATEVDLAGVGRWIIRINAAILLVIIILEWVAGRAANWIFGWPPDPAFWVFAAVDAVQLVLVWIAGVDYRSVRRNVQDDQKTRPWILLDRAREFVMDAAPMTLNDKRRTKALDDALNHLLPLTTTFRTWIEPVEASVLVHWLQGGPGYAAIEAEQERVVALLPEEPGPRLALAHVLTCAVLFHDEASPNNLEQARKAANEAIVKAKTRSLPHEVMSACQEALGDTYLAAHDWANAVTAYTAGYASIATTPLGDHPWRCTVKQAVALLGRAANSAQMSLSEIRQALGLLEQATRRVLVDVDGNVRERAPVGLQAPIAIARLLLGDADAAKDVVEEALYRVLPSAQQAKSNDWLRLEQMHLGLVRDLIELSALQSVTDLRLRDLTDQYYKLKKELEGIEPRDEYGNVPVALFKLASSLLARACEIAGERQRSTSLRRAVVSDPKSPVLLAPGEPSAPLNVLLGMWAALEINRQGFFQSLEDRRGDVGPRFLAWEHDPTASEYELELALYREPGFMSKLAQKRIAGG